MPKTTTTRCTLSRSFTILTLAYTAVLIFVTIQIEIDNRKNNQNNNDLDILPLVSVIVIPSFLIMCYRVRETWGEFGRITIEVWSAQFLLGAFVYAIQLRVGDDALFVILPVFHMISFPGILVGCWSLVATMKKWDTINQQQRSEPIMQQQKD